MNCVYDNPKSMMRECWQDGRLLCAYSYLFFFPSAVRNMMNVPPKSSVVFFFGCDQIPWSVGRISGDKEALPSNKDADREGGR